MDVANNRHFRIQCKLRFRYRKRPVHLLPVAWQCTKCNKQLDEFRAHAHACKHLKGELATRHNALRNDLHAAAHTAKEICTRSEPTMLSLGAVPKPELSHEAQTELKIPEHGADIAIIPDPN